jgi:hypothetical protein
VSVVPDYDGRPLPGQRVGIVYCNPGNVVSHFHNSIVRLLLSDCRRRHPRIVFDSPVIGITTGPRVHSARNNLVRSFLKFTPKADWMWMLDADIQFEPYVLDRLMAIADPKEKPVVAGLYIGGGYSQMFPLMYEIVDPATNDNNPVRYVEHWTPGDLIKCHATGAGCLLIHRSVLERMAEEFPEPAPWFSETIWKGREFGEDWSFCLRLMKMGIPLYVKTGLGLGHVKPLPMTEELWFNYRDERDAARELEAVSA